jgi:sugar phosphate isomerase/epimerase
MALNALQDLEIGLCWGTLQRARLIALIEAAGRHGFPTLSIRPDQVAACLESGLGAAGLRRRLRDAGVRVRVIDAMSGLPGQPPAEGAPEGSPPATNEDLCYQAAEIVEAPIVNLTHYQGVPTPKPQLVDAVGEICARARRRGFDIVLEFIPDTGLSSVKLAFEVLQAIAAPNLAILLDPWHWSRSGGALDDLRRLPPGAIGAFQLCDRTAPPPGTPYVPMSGRDLPGEGELPLHELTRIALANNPRLTAEIEVFSEDLRGLAVDDAAARVAAAVQAWRAAP